MDLVADEFNDFFFLNVGPSLAKEIITLSSDDGVANDIMNVNTHSIFIRQTNEKEIIDIVKNVGGRME